MTSVEDIVGSFDSLGLDEMDRVALMNRIDTKYLFGTEQLPTLLQTMTAGYQVLRVEDFRISSYSTLYFDTPRHDFFLQHHNGKLNRHKIRMRKYLLSNTCFLEMKTKNNKGRTTKRRIQIEDFEETFSPKSATFLRSVVEDLPELVPQLQSGFSRITLVHRDQPERVTLDFDIAFSHDNRTECCPGIVIAEVKQNRNQRNSPARELMHQRHIGPMRVSKYCLGSVLLKPALKYNRFKSKLRAIRKIANRH
jgi:hypothetical protein